MSREVSQFLEPSRKRNLKLILICFVVLIVIYPFESVVLPVWKLRVVDMSGNACPNMQVNQGWSHYSLRLQSPGDSEFRFTNQSGDVQFPARTIRASLLRRTVVPIIAHVMVIAHGSTGIHGYVFATGMRDGPFMNYEPGKQLPSRLVVEKCYNARTEDAYGADSP